MILGSSARAAAGGDGFSRGNSFYANGDYTRAAAAYEEQVRQGVYTANLFYNLADAYYRQGSRGRAILNYQRALILDPTHAEAAANLAFLRGSKAVGPPRAEWKTTDLCWLAAGGFWLATAGMVVVAAGRRRRTSGLVLITMGLLVGVAGLATIHGLDKDADDSTRAVVVADNAPALYAPADNSKVITNLTAGAEVRVLSDQGAWVYALLGEGTRAWLASDKIERVVPR